MPATNERNNQLKAAMHQKETPLNKDSGKGQVPCGPNQSGVTKRPTGHVEVGTGRKL